jgi:hypothetical protein
MGSRLQSVLPKSAAPSWAGTSSFVIPRGVEEWSEPGGRDIDGRTEEIERAGASESISHFKNF